MTLSLADDNSHQQGLQSEKCESLKDSPKYYKKSIYKLNFD